MMYGKMFIMADNKSTVTTEDLKNAEVESVPAKKLPLRRLQRRRVTKCYFCVMGMDTPLVKCFSLGIILTSW